MRRKQNHIEGLSVPQEFDETAIQPAAIEAPRLVDKPGDNFKFCASRPTVDITIPASGGKTRTVTVVDKDQFFSLPSRELQSRASCLAVKATSGHVIVCDRAGEVIAKYESAADALTRLREAQVDLSRVANAGRLNLK